MPNSPAPHRPEPGDDAGVDKIEADIEATRAALADTVSALADKADVKARAHDKVDETVEKTKATVAETKATVQQAVEKSTAEVRANQGSAAGIAIGAVVLVGLLLWWRRRP